MLILIQTGLGLKKKHRYIYNFCRGKIFSRFLSHVGYKLFIENCNPLRNLETYLTNDKYITIRAGRHLKNIGTIC